jgi:chemotaxis protein MotB
LAGASLAAVVGRGLEERARTRAALTVARDEAAELRKRLFRTEDRALVAEKERVRALEALDAVSAELTARATERDQQAGLIHALEAKLESKEGEVSLDQNRVRVDLVDEVLFASGEAEVSPRGREVLARVGGVLKGLKDKQILVGGHTDDRPIHTERFPSNWELSSARAVNVVRYLQDIVGVDGSKLAAAGYSQFHPRGRDRAKNRRIEILLTPWVEPK